MKNIISGIIAMVAFLFVFGIENANAGLTPEGTNFCTTSNNATFNFSVEPAISVIGEDLVLNDICPGCENTWNCDNGPFMKFWIKGSLNCKFSWDYSNLIPADGQDKHAWLKGCLRYLDTYSPEVWTNWITNDETFDFLPDGNGGGIWGVGFNVEKQGADCYAKGAYSWTFTITADYVCSNLQD